MKQHCKAPSHAGARTASDVPLNREVEQLVVGRKQGLRFVAFIEEVST